MTAYGRVISLPTHMRATRLTPGQGIKVVVVDTQRLGPGEVWGTKAPAGLVRAVWFFLQLGPDQGHHQDTIVSSCSE